MTGAAPQAESTRNAGIVSRGVAAVIDLLVVLAVMGAAYLGLILATLAFSPRAFSFPAPSLVFSAFGLGAVAVLYLAGCWRVSGCTAGAVVMGLRVEGRTSPRLRVTLCLARALGCVLFPIGLAWVAVDGQRRSLQDIVIGSRVVYNRAP
ncbi:RDD family protein [Mycolicibacterium komossense]|uniref:RDD family protein n=1 Tax=Mycolicibacterium komossense TaxID=1779 RepID=A0ABT3CBT6_9MYCO|nr:RDD family protein [Mycolicibacterium komossense]MCV7226711.1 RDD family protein [Mycolicibacterium komossense]